MYKRMRELTHDEVIQNLREEVIKSVGIPKFLLKNFNCKLIKGQLIIENK